MKVIAIIPARSGSKGVINKNIKLLGKKPLIAYTIEEAKKSKLIDKLVVSTDSLEIAEIAEKFGANVPFIRPAELATDTSLTYDVIKHCIDHFEILGEKFDIILLLQPTVPFRKLDHIDKSIQMLKKSSSFTSVVSIVNVDGNHPLRMKKIEKEFLRNYIDQETENMAPRASLPKVYIRSGSIYCILVKNFQTEISLVSRDCAPLILSEEETINIDSQLDFNFCEFLLNRNK